MATSLYASKIEQSESSIDGTFSSSKCIMDLSERLPDSKHGSLKFGKVSSAIATLREDTLRFLENEQEEVFCLEKMQKHYKPLFYINLSDRNALEADLIREKIPFKDSLEIYDDASTSIPYKTIKGYRVSFFYGAEAIDLEFYPARLETTFGLYNIEGLIQYRKSLFNSKQIFSTECIIKALRKESAFFVDRQKGQWTIETEPSPEFEKLLSNRESTFKFYLQAPYGFTETESMPPMNGYIATQNNIEFVRREIMVRVYAPQNESKYEQMSFNISLKSTFAEESYVYHCTFRDKLKSLQENNDFTDVVFLTEK